MKLKIGAILNLVGGTLIALAGTFVVLWCGAFLSAAPRDHYGEVAWAFCIITVGIYLMIGGIGHARFGAVRLQGRQQNYMDND